MSASRDQGVPRDERAAPDEASAGPRVGRRASDAALAEFAHGARRDGLRLVVGALIHDAGNRLYLQRRTLSRALFPGSWDLVGGHAEAGEDVHEALAREVLEETGWRLARLGPVVELLDWEEGGVKRREIDLLVTVAGDLANPRLEADKHSEGRWVSAAELASLEAERAEQAGVGGPDAWVFKVARRAFEILGAVSDPD